MTDTARSLGGPVAADEGAARLPRPPGVIRQFWARHPWLVETAVAASYFVPLVVGTLVGAGDGTSPPWVVGGRLVIIAAVTAAMLLFRRRRPWVLLGAAWVSSLLVYPADNADVFAILIALYALAVYASPRAAWIGCGISAIVGTVSAIIATGIDQPASAPAVSASVSSALMVGAMLIATLIGINVGNRRRYLAALIARVGDLARERDQQAQLATALERSRIAREMHDIVSHSLTVMVTMAEGSAAAAPRDPARAAEGMRHVAETGREALVDMRRMLGVLAAPDTSAVDDRAPQPGTSAIPGLVESFRSSGLPVRYSTSGSPIADPNLQLTVYRIVQEALTNALRYAASAENVDVTIEHVDGEVRLTVIDDAVPVGVRRSDGGGRGLIGMRERVALYGGTLEAGPRRYNGWRVHAVLPDVASMTQEPST